MSFYVVQPNGERFGTTWAYGQMMPPMNFGEPLRCPQCDRPVGQRKWLEPRNLCLSSSKPAKWGDLVWGDGFHFLVSDRFKRVFSKYGLTGITKFLPPVEIVKFGHKNAEEFHDLPAYYPVFIELFAADINDDKSNTIRRYHSCQYCRGDVLTISKIVVDESSWLGQDIFIARGLYGLVLVSEKFKYVTDSENLANIQLIPALSFGYDYGSNEDRT